MDEKSLLVQIEQKDKAYATLMDQFNKLQAEKNNLQEKNKKIMEMLNISDKSRENAEKELEKANAVFNNEFEKRSSLQRQYDEIKIKNANICSTIADMVRKIMQE